MALQDHQVSSSSGLCHYLDPTPEDAPLQDEAVGSSSDVELQRLRWENRCLYRRLQQMEQQLEQQLDDHYAEYSPEVPSDSDTEPSSSESSSSESEEVDSGPEPESEPEPEQEAGQRRR